MEVKISTMVLAAAIYLVAAPFVRKMGFAV